MQRFSRERHIEDRDLAQLVAHTSGGREVAGSSPVIPTKTKKGPQMRTFFCTLLPFTPFTLLLFYFLTFFRTGPFPCSWSCPVRSMPPSVPQSLCESQFPKRYSFSYALLFYLFTFLPLIGRYALRNATLLPLGGRMSYKIFLKILHPLF